MQRMKEKTEQEFYVNGINCDAKQLVKNMSMSKTILQDRRNKPITDI